MKLCDELFYRICGQAVCAGQVNECNLEAIIDSYAELLFNGNAGVVGNALAGAGKGVEDRGLAAVGIAG